MKLLYRVDTKSGLKQKHGPTSRGVGGGASGGDESAGLGLRGGDGEEGRRVFRSTFLRVNETGKHK
jgi:hypothetical protein